MSTISIKGLSKAKVLAALYNNSRAQGMGFIHANAQPMSEAEAQKLLSQDSYFDYLRGRVMKVDLSGDELDTRLYDRDLGQGAAEAAVNSIRVPA